MELQKQSQAQLWKDLEKAITSTLSRGHFLSLFQIEIAKSHLLSTQVPAGGSLRLFQPLFCL